MTTVWSQHTKQHLNHKKKKKKKVFKQSRQLRKTALPPSLIENKTVQDGKGGLGDNFFFFPLTDKSNLVPLSTQKQRISLSSFSYIILSHHSINKPLDKKIAIGLACAEYRTNTASSAVFSHLPTATVSHTHTHVPRLTGNSSERFRHTHTTAHTSGLFFVCCPNKLLFEAAPSDL